FFFLSSRRRHTRFSRDWSSDVCSSDLTVTWLPWAEIHLATIIICAYHTRLPTTIFVKRCAVLKKHWPSWYNSTPTAAGCAQGIPLLLLTHAVTIRNQKRFRLIF